MEEVVENQTAPKKSTSPKQSPIDISAKRLEKVIVEIIKSNASKMANTDAKKSMSIPNVAKSLIMQFINDILTEGFNETIDHELLSYPNHREDTCVCPICGTGTDLLVAFADYSRYIEDNIVWNIVHGSFMRMFHDIRIVVCRCKQYFDTMHSLNMNGISMIILTLYSKTLDQYDKVLAYINATVDVLNNKKMQEAERKKSLPKKTKKKKPDEVVSDDIVADEDDTPDGDECNGDDQDEINDDDTDNIK